MNSNLRSFYRARRDALPGTLVGVHGSGLRVAHCKAEKKVARVEYDATAPSHRTARCSVASSATISGSPVAPSWARTLAPLAAPAGFRLKLGPRPR